MLVERVEFTADGLRQQLRLHLTAGEIAEIERAAWEQVLNELRHGEIRKSGVEAI